MTDREWLLQIVSTMLITGGFAGLVNMLVNWMKVQTSIWPNTMVRRQKWRYWAHRFGYLWSPSCGYLNIPFSDLKRQKNGVSYGWLCCSSCVWESRHRKDINDQMNPLNWREYARHTATAHAWPSHPTQIKSENHSED